MTDFAPDAVLSFFEQTQRAKERRARLWGGAPRRVNGPMRQAATRSDVHEEKITTANDNEVPPAEVTIRYILRHVSAFYGITTTDIVSARRTADIILPRQIAAYLARTMTVKSFPAIGNQLGKRDHTTILHAVCMVEKALRESADLAAEVVELMRRIEAREPPAAGNSSIVKKPRASASRSFWNAENVGRLIAMWEQGLSVSACAQRLGRKLDNVSWKIAHLGLTNTRGRA